MTLGIGSLPLGDGLDDSAEHHTEGDAKADVLKDKPEDDAHRDA